VGIGLIGVLKTLFRQKKFMIGMILVIPIVLLGTIGPLLVPREETLLGALPSGLPPSSEHIFGTDTYGRDIFALLCYSIGPSLQIGIVAGVGMAIIGFAVGLVWGYKGGFIGGALGSVTNVVMVMPTWPLIICLAAYVRSVSVLSLALLLAAFGWPWYARTVASQVLNLKERTFVSLAKLNGQSDLSIIFVEILPNLGSYLVASIVADLSFAIRTEVGLEIIGLGPAGQQTLGWMIYYMMYGGAVTKGMWWWILPPVVTLIALFIGLQLLNLGLDVVFNPRLRK
jgi:peptide/nickel transport system permease protein